MGMMLRRYHEAAEEKKTVNAPVNKAGASIEDKPAAPKRGRKSNK